MRPAATQIRNTVDTIRFRLPAAQKAAAARVLKTRGETFSSVMRRVVDEIVRTGDVPVVGGNVPNARLRKLLSETANGKGMCPRCYASAKELFDDVFAER